MEYAKGKFHIQLCRKGELLFLEWLLTSRLLFFGMCLDECLILQHKHIRLIFNTKMSIHLHFDYYRHHMLTKIVSRLHIFRNRNRRKLHPRLSIGFNIRWYKFYKHFSYHIMNSRRNMVCMQFPLGIVQAHMDSFLYKYRRSVGLSWHLSKLDIHYFLVLCTVCMFHGI